MTTPSTPAAPTPASPSPATLLTQPQLFFEALRATPPQPARYLWVVALTSLISALSTTLLARHAIEAQSDLLSGAAGGAAISPLLSYGAAAFASIFVTVLLWLALWALGTLGAGKEGRAAEVYAATFVPSLIWAIILLPLALFFAPQMTVAAPNISGLSGAELQQALQHYAQQVRAAAGSSALSKLSTYLGYAVYLWQFALAFTGFRVLTGSSTKAWRGVLLPLGLLVVLVVAGYLASQAVTGLTGV